MSTSEPDHDEESNSKPLIAETKICCICLLSGSTDDSDPIVYCDRCGVIVHESCYNADTLDDKSSDSSSPSEHWFCTPCLARIDDPTCALCPTQDRCLAFWPTLESSWVHVVCAVGVPGVLYYDELYYTPVDLSNVPATKFGNKPCHVCESRAGVTVSCDAGLCPNAFHLSCAHKNGLLQMRGELSKIECELYCVTHQSSSNTYKNVQRNYSICEVQQKQLDRRDQLEDDVRQTLTSHWSIYKTRSETFPKLPKPAKSHLARSLMVDPIALKNFFDKAQRLRPSQPSTLSNNLDLTSNDSNALLAFAANEEELGQLRERVAEAEKKLAQLETSPVEKQLREEQKKLEAELRKEYETLATLTERYNRFIELFQLYNCPLKEETSNITRPQLSTTAASEMESCSVCKQMEQANQMIKCCQCRLAFHGDCLKPPMPAKTLAVMLSATKKYEWQCASCVNAQQEELDQRNVNVDAPRQIRPRRTNELVLRESVIKFGSRKRKNDSTNSNEAASDKKKAKATTNQSDTTSKATSRPTTPSPSKEIVSPKRDEEQASTSKSRTSVIKQLFTRKTTEATPESTSKRSSTSPKKGSNSAKPPRISIKKPPESKTTDDSATPVRSTSLVVDRRTPTIFKQKSTSLPLAKPDKKKRKSTKDPLSIFDFFDDDENANGALGLRSSMTNSSTNDDDREEKPAAEQKAEGRKPNRRSKVTVENHVPADATCRECSNSGTNQDMTDCDKCKHFYHYACCVPPLSAFPKRRNYGWTCHRCNEEDDDDVSTEANTSSTTSKGGRRGRPSQKQSNDKEVPAEE